MTDINSLDWEQMPLEELLKAQKNITTALSNKGVPLNETESEIPEVIRVSLRRYNASIEMVTPKHLINSLLKEYDKCIMGISLASANMEGAKFEACIKFISENFQQCALLVGDSIYSYTLQVKKELPPEQAKSMALKLGQEFMANYESIIKKYSDSCEFHWQPVSQIEQYPKFPKYLEEFHQLYETSPDFHALVEDFSKIYLNRVLDDTDGLTQETPAMKKEFARLYLLKESAMLTCLCEDDWSVLLYPGSIKTFENVAEGKIDNVPKPLQKIVFVSLRLRKGGYYLADGKGGFNTAELDEEAELSSGYQVLADLSEDDWKRLLRYAKIKNFRAGDIIVRQDHTDQSLYILLKGSVEILVGDLNAKHLKQVALFGDGSVFGEQSFVDGEPRTANIGALSDCEILFLSKNKFKKMLKQDSDLAASLLLDIGRVLSLRLRHNTLIN